VSALVLAPVALAAVWLGGAWLAVLVLVAVGGMGWEWARLCGYGAVGLTGAAIIGTGIGAVAAFALGKSGAVAALVAVAGSVVVFGMAAQRRGGEAGWTGAGTLWLTLGAVAFLWLRDASRDGRDAALLVLGVVWTSDVAAYAVGRTLGGPRLAPSISPGKTWAGFAGGLAGVGLIGGLVAALAGASPGRLVLTCLGLGIATQLGDLVESMAKRHFGVKDSSGLIPGHGGLLDRLDGLLAAALAAALMGLGSGAELRIWP
jgi:phosphatidate cytidylyltransferase